MSAKNEADSSYAAFLESYPLYRKYKRAVAGEVYNVERPAIHMYCPNCKSDQTFRMSNQLYDRLPYGNYPTAGMTLLAQYTCAACEKPTRHFLLYFSDGLDYVMKVGQYPPWSIAVDSALARVLGDQADTYKRGLTCESQGYGIGAYAYYRRVVETTIGGLLVSIEDLLDGNERAAYAKALAEVARSTVAADKIALVKDLLPAALRPGGMNPLAILHEQLSRGIHELPDEECLELAAHTRDIIEFLVTEVERHAESAKRATDSMKRLLARKSGSQP